VVATLALVFVLVAAPAPAGADSAGSPGSVNFVRPAESSFDKYTKDDRHAAFMNQKYWRMRAYGPYFDSRLSWAPATWMYMNAYAIYRDQEVARDHPEWILRDKNGNRLYIPFGCENGTCPQYAADIGNPEWREHFISIAAEKMQLGYKGLFIDDVNMRLTVGNGNGDDVAPVDPRTGREMTEATWRRYMADFMEQVRKRLPHIEIVHNSVWFAPAGPDVDRQIRAADVIEVERGINDGGLTGGNGFWSLRNLLRYIDRVHQLGANVVLDSYVDSVAEREYGLAGYFLISNGGDGIGNDRGSRPDDWWVGYDTELGAPLGSRYEWAGLIRRDFERGTVLLNPPDSPTRTVDVGSGHRRVDGTPVTEVRLGAARGVVLTRPTGAAPVLQAPQPPVASSAPEPASAPAPARRHAPAPAPAPASAPVAAAPAAPASSARPARRSAGTPRALRARTVRRAAACKRVELKKTSGRKSKKRARAASRSRKSRTATKRTGSRRVSERTSRRCMLRGSVKKSSRRSSKKSNAGRGARTTSRTRSKA
jgi:hypothetical protein